MTGGSWFHASKTVVARSAGRSVVAAAAYRTGLCLHDQREQLTHDYTRKHGVAEAFVTTPQGKGNFLWAHDIERLTNAMEVHEKRKDSQVGHEWTIALPAALDGAQQSELSHRISQALSDMYGVAVIAAVHEPGHQGDERNDHLHLLFPTRELGEDGKLGAKITSITGLKTGPQEVTRFRTCVADLINEALGDVGSDERVDARSFAARGIDMEPTKKMGVAATALERRGIATDRGDINRQIIEDRLADQDGDAKEIRDELAARFGEVEPEQLKGRAAGRDHREPDEASFQKLLKEARSGTPVPDDLIAHAKAGRVRMDDDVGVSGQHVMAAPPGWFERMRHVATHLADVWREEKTDHDHGKVGMLMHAARVLKRVLRHEEEPDEKPPKEEAELQSFADRIAQTGRDILTNERGSIPGDRMEDWWEQMREQLGETYLPPDFHSHEPDEPEHDTGPDLDMGR